MKIKGHLRKVGSKNLHDRRTKILSVYSNQLKMIKNANQIYSRSSVITEGYANSILEKVKEGSPVELIVPLNVAEELNSRLMQRNWRY